MISEKDLAKTNLSFSFKIAPVENVVCDLSLIVGNFVEEVLTAFYSKPVSKKANTVITELINNVLENTVYKDSEVSVELQLISGHLKIKVLNEVNKEQYEYVKAHVDKILSSSNIKGLLKETIHERRQKRLKGGLGLMRLVAENKFNIDVDFFNNKYLVVESQIELGGLV